MAQNQIMIWSFQLSTKTKIANLDKLKYPCCYSFYYQNLSLHKLLYTLHVTNLLTPLTPTYIYRVRFHCPDQTRPSSLLYLKQICYSFDRAILTNKIIFFGAAISGKINVSIFGYKSINCGIHNCLSTHNSKGKIHMVSNWFLWASHSLRGDDITIN